MDKKLKFENIQLEPYGFSIDTKVNPTGHEDYIINRNSEFLRREHTLDKSLLFCTRVMLRELREVRDKQGMAKEDIIKQLKECNSGDLEGDHGKADKLLLKYINDKEVKEVFDNIEKWYA